MSNDRNDDERDSRSHDPDEVRLVTRDELQSTQGLGRTTGDMLKEANQAARREAKEPQAEAQSSDERSVALRISEEGLIDLRSGEQRELGASAPTQPSLPNLDRPISPASPTAGVSGAVDPNDWLSALGTASGLGAVKLAERQDDPDSEHSREDVTHPTKAVNGQGDRPSTSDDTDSMPEVPINTNALPGETEADGGAIVAPSGDRPVTHPEAPTSPEVAGGEPGEPDEPGDGRRFRDDRDEPVVARPKGPSFGERTKEARLSLPKRVGTGLAFVVAAIAAFSAGPTWTLVLVTAVLLFAAVEYFDALRRVGFKPATALGLLAVFGCSVAAYTRGEQGLLFILAASVFFTLAWYLAGIVRQAPTANIAVTLLGIFWIGALGSFAGLLLRMPEREGMTLLIGTVLVTAAYDTAAYAGGVMFGRRKLAPSISPTKSWEGLIAGTGAALITGALIVALMSPWTLVGGLTLGLIVAVLAPIGDLAESMIKRDLGLKDMGRILPGHGGVLDRFDALLLVLPGAFYMATFLVV